MAGSLIQPGEILADELQEIGVTPTELARQTKVPANRLTQIIHGCRGITGDTALRLGHWFGNSAQFWLNLQTAYEIRGAELKAGKKVRKLPVRPSAGEENQPTGTSHKTEANLKIRERDPSSKRAPTQMP